MNPVNFEWTITLGTMIQIVGMFIGLAVLLRKLGAFELKMDMLWREFVGDELHEGMPLRVGKLEHEVANLKQWRELHPHRSPF